MNFQKLKIKQKLMIIMIALLAGSGIITCIIVDRAVTGIARRDLDLKIRSDNALGLSLLNAKAPGKWEIKENRLVKGGQLMEGRFDVVDEIKRRTGSLATIFKYDTRVSTNVVKEDGTRAIGTQAAPEVIERVLKEGKPYNGEADILGYKHETMYIPIRDRSGKVIGMWFTGVEKETVQMQIKKINNILYGFILIMVLVGVVIANLFTRRILKSLPLLKENFSSAAGGDLRVETPVLSQDEIGQISAAFNEMIGQQRTLLGKVKETTQQFRTAVYEINQGNQDLAQRTQEQASTLEEVASTIELTNSSLQQIADHTSQADGISRHTLENVQEGEQAIKETEQAMVEITASSQKIAEIIRVVNDIAFQTNLLALNAAVEAARAGEQGRGFAVVAAEVRNLAGRTAESSKEIEQLIQDSVEKTKKGNLSVRHSSDILKEIVQNAKRTSDIITEITAAVKEQSISSNQIETAVEQLNQVTQQNAAMVQEITASAATLNDQAENLVGSVAKFELGEG